MGFKGNLQLLFVFTWVLSDSLILAEAAESEADAGILINLTWVLRNFFNLCCYTWFLRKLVNICWYIHGFLEIPNIFAAIYMGFKGNLQFWLVFTWVLRPEAAEAEAA